MSSLSKQEQAALAMHELMKREQQRYRERVDEQRRITLLDDDSLRKLVEGNGLVPTDKGASDD